MDGALDRRHAVCVNGTRSLPTRTPLRPAALLGSRNCFGLSFNSGMLRCYDFSAHTYDAEPASRRQDPQGPSNTPPPPCTTIDSPPKGPRPPRTSPRRRKLQAVTAAKYRSPSAHAVDAETQKQQQKQQQQQQQQYQTRVESWLCVVCVASRLPQFSAATHRQDRNGTRWPRSFDQSLELKRLRALESQTDVGAAVQRQRPPRQPGYAHTPGLSVGGAERGR
ncbi:hypothetical protein MRS44_012723 [Fusarium solani]|uniref:uncharacterized protein n=1 Tax=Fusarium solani TaxID=169388 RepID=UPI0032C3E0D5|nr:hypothetical protein MRS44_012723 [Fusarium solani]